MFWIVVFLVVTTLVLLARTALHRNRFHGQCDHCGYDCRALPSSKCPECGRDRRDENRRTRRKWLSAAMVLGIPLLFVVTRIAYGGLWSLVPSWCLSPFLNASRVASSTDDDAFMREIRARLLRGELKQGPLSNKLHALIKADVATSQILRLVQNADRDATMICQFTIPRWLTRLGVSRLDLVSGDYVIATTGATLPGDPLPSPPTSWKDGLQMFMSDVGGDKGCLRLRAWAFDWTDQLRTLPVYSDVDITYHLAAQSAHAVGSRECSIALIDEWLQSHLRAGYEERDVLYVWIDDNGSASLPDDVAIAARLTVVQAESSLVVGSFCLTCNPSDPLPTWFLPIRVACSWSLVTEDGNDAKSVVFDVTSDPDRACSENVGSRVWKGGTRVHVKLENRLESRQPQD